MGIETRLCFGSIKRIDFWLLTRRSLSLCNSTTDCICVWRVSTRWSSRKLVCSRWSGRRLVSSWCSRRRLFSRWSNRLWSTGLSSSRSECGRGVSGVGAVRCCYISLIISEWKEMRERLIIVNGTFWHFQTIMQTNYVLLVGR